MRVRRPGIEWKVMRQNPKMGKIWANSQQENRKWPSARHGKNSPKMARKNRKNDPNFFLPFCSPIFSGPFFAPFRAEGHFLFFLLAHIFPISGFRHHYPLTPNSTTIAARMITIRAKMINNSVQTTGRPNGITDRENLFSN